MRWNTIFFVTQSEKRGTLLLLLLVFILLIVRVVLAQETSEKAHFTEKNNPFYSDSLASPVRPFVKQVKTDQMVELNTADTTVLKQLRGIGSGYAKMIVNYRGKLGGFYSKEQLLEVYHFSQTTYNKIEAQVWVDTTQVQKLYINQLSIDALKHHPYIRYFQAKSLFNNRLKQPNQRYNGIKDLVIDRDVTSDFIQRIAPYLSFQ